MSKEAARELATGLAKAYQIREASYMKERPEGGRFSEGHYTKDWHQCADEAGIPEEFKPLVPLLMHWSNDTSEWVQSILGHGLDGTQ